MTKRKGDGVVEPVPARDLQIGQVIETEYGPQGVRGINIVVQLANGTDLNVFNDGTVDAHTQLQLKGGFVTRDVRLDRLEQFDKRSKKFPIRELVEAKKPRSYTWSCEKFLDQGSEGACVGFSWAHELIARPVAVTSSSEAVARDIYRRAQLVDEWPGEDYSGTSVLAGAKVIQEMGYMDEYRWAFGLDDLIMALGYHGPAVLGIDWHEGMYRPDEKDFIHRTGEVMGGHAILAMGVSIKNKAVKLHNSWGRDWGGDGECWISFDDLGALLSAGGEACIPVRRDNVPA